jgi:cyclophilin family peptidyl-prolyl cis-trans isomerase
MARTSAPDSATSQFFINFGDNSVLDYVSESQDGYAVFGRVVTGLEVVEAIYNLERFTNFASPFQELPVEPVIITGITRHEMPGDDGR